MKLFSKKEVVRIDLVRKDAELVKAILEGLNVEVEDLGPGQEITCLRVKAPLSAIQLLLDNLLLEGGVVRHKER